MAGGWLGVKSIPLGKRAELTLPLSQPDLRKCGGLNLIASACMQPSHRLIQGWVANGSVWKAQGGKGRFLSLMRDLHFA